MNPQPGLNGALFLFSQKKKKAGVEDGLAAQKKSTNLLTAFSL